MIASAITLGSVGSGGRERGQLSKNICRLWLVPGDHVWNVERGQEDRCCSGYWRRNRAIFRSPFAGVILSAEILYSGGDMEVEALTPTFIASPVGYVIFASFTNFSPMFNLYAP
jgi:CIC family chloride channel protein